MATDCIIVNVKDYPGGIDRSIAYIHGKWGNPANYSFYDDAIRHSSLPGNKLPKFFLMTRGDRIIGCCGLITNDFISRGDLYPWLACLFVEEDERRRGHAGLLIDYTLRAAKLEGFTTIYLTTHLDGFYERYGWTRIEDGILFDGSPSRIYRKDT
jgi:GNAT superfamily N-acetyltransferase